MNRLAVFFVLVLPLSLTARADDASLHSKAQELVTVLHTDRMVQQVGANLNKQFADAADRAANNNPTPDQAKQIADFEKKASTIIDSQLGWQTLQPSFVDIYAKTFSEDQLDAIIAFYKSPAGIAFLDKTPTLNSQITQTLQAKIGTVQGQLRASLEELRKNLTNPPAAANSPQPTQPSSAPK